MRAFVCPAPSAPPQLAELPDPLPGPGEVAVRIRACGLNFADLLMLDGKYQDMPPPPFVPGLELAGEVTALGPGVETLRPGTGVAVFAGHGGLAQAGVFPAERCLPIPPGMSWVEAAGFQIAYGTAHLALTHRARLQPGETLLVLGAAGGVGLTAVEVGKRLGATVIASARGAARLETARAAGADHLVDSEAADMKERLRDLGGVDVVFDAVGNPGFDTALRAMKPLGRMLAIGFAGGQVPAPPANLLLVKNLDVIGFYWGGYQKFAPHLLAGSLAALVEWYRRGWLKPHVSHVLPLERAAEGLDLLRTRRATGKVVVTTD